MYMYINVLIDNYKWFKNQLLGKEKKIIVYLPVINGI